MHIVECHFEFTGFDDHLVKAGTSVYLWNLVRQFRARGHRVTAVTAAHGLLPELRRAHDITTLDWQLREDIPVRLDPLVWPGFPELVTISVACSAHQLTIDGIDIVMLSSEVLDTWSDSLYPPASAQGTDLSYLKPLVFQVVAARFLAGRAGPDTVVHLHEPLYHHLLAAALPGHGYTVVSTVQTNLPVNTKVYGPEVRAILGHLGVDPVVADGLDDPPLDSALHRAMRSYLPQTLLYRDYPERPGHDYLSVLALVIRSVAAMDFLSEGQLEHVLTQAETPFEQLYASLAVRRELRLRADRLVVGGCAIGDEWLDVERSPQRRRRTLSALDLDPELPTIYHNGRYSVEHKGLREMFKALRGLLDSGERCNVLLHCLAPQPPRDHDLDALRRDHPTLVRVRTGPMAPGELIDWAASSDLCVFAAKFEMDTFLMAMGEAMSAGAVPVATAQRGMRHFRHSGDLHDGATTGLAVPRSFRVDDPLLTDAVQAGLHRMSALVRAGDPLIEVLRDRAVAVSRQHTWGQAADRFLAVFTACLTGVRPADAVATPIVTAVRGAAAVPDQGLHLPPAGRGTATAQGAHVDVRWCDVDAALAEVVVPGEPAEVIPLRRLDDGSFGGRAPLPDTGDLAVLITRRDGRSVWARAAVGPRTP